MRVLLQLCLICQFALAEAQDTSFISKLKEISRMPPTSFTIDLNGFNIPEGGHFQGVQLHPDENHIVITGSSHTEAYGITVELASHKIVAYHKLMEKPLKHAGGMQVLGNYLAVGIEDNEEKDTSIVCIYDVQVPFIWHCLEGKIIERGGKPMKATAGAVALMHSGTDTFDLLVANWGSKDIDTYHSLTYDRWSKSAIGRSEKIYKPYQNLNYIDPYLLGFYRNGLINQMDVMVINDGNLQLVETIAFKSKEGNFQHAAGYSLWRDKPVIFATEGLTVYTFR